MHVRHITQNDVNSYRALRESVLHETDFMLREPGEYTPNQHQVAEEIDSIIASENSIILVADSGADLVGFIEVKGGALKRTRHCAVVFLAVRKECWGQEIGKSLLSAAVRWAEESPLVRLELEVATENKRAISLYRNLGFEIEGTKEQSVRVGSRYYDDHVMALLC